MEAIILAGGLGTRLREVVKDVPKPMAPVNSKPFLQYLLDYLKKNQITKVILAVGYKWEVIKDYFGDEYAGMQLEYSIEQEQLGTGGAIKQALKQCEMEHVLIVNGDTYFDINLKSMYIQHIGKKAELTIAIKEMKQFERYGTIRCDGDRITQFEEKKFNEIGYINGGIYICKKELLSKIKEIKFSFEKDVMEKYVRNYYFSVFESKGYFMDIGVPEDYMKFEKDMKQE